MEKKTLKQLRIEAGKNKRQFSIMLGIPYTSYLRYEDSLAGASFSEVERICKVLGIGIEAIAS